MVGNASWLLQTTEETELTMPSDFRWHSFLVSAGYLPDTIQEAMMRKMDIRKQKAGNISKIKGNQETSDRVYGRYWT